MVRVSEFSLLLLSPRYRPCVAPLRAVNRMIVQILKRRFDARVKYALFVEENSQQVVPLQ